MTRMKLLLFILLKALVAATSVSAQDNVELAEPEQQAMSDTVQHALEYNMSNQSSEWVNPDTANSGGVTPVRTFENAQGQPCREFVSTIIIGGQQQQGYGTACRQADGSWQIADDDSSIATVPPPAAATTIYVDRPPPRYYYYPPDFYYPYRIYLSFGSVYRGGYVYPGAYFLDGPVFRERHPLYVRERLFISPRDSARYGRFKRWWHHHPRGETKIHHEYGKRKKRHDWQRR
ncbi:MAG: RT0821/Lpp0805 family surface protein [Gammaproteobacteria bacterium]|nr:RT0821/Lpp0805 family surface protein [Gammaproteobacteria bacterium]MDH3450229.1 RT0821/Lpp0805 family surface protein [Gammaproteobacteria bacterium]